MYTILLSLTSLINGKYLRRHIIENNCCPLLSNHNPCCTIEYNYTLFFASAVEQLYEQQCCDVLTCTINLGECNNCSTYNSDCIQSIDTEFFTIKEINNTLHINPYLPHISHHKKYEFEMNDGITIYLDNNISFNNILPLNYNENIIIQSNHDNIEINAVYDTYNDNTACIEWDTMKINEENFIRINVRTNKFKKISGIQFSYESDISFNGSITTPTTFQYEYLSYDINTKIVFMILKPRLSQQQGTFLYIPYTEFTYFRIKNMIVSDDVFPIKAYTIKC